MRNMHTSHEHDGNETTDGAPGQPLVDRPTAVRRDVYHGLVSCLVSNPKLWTTVDVAQVKDLMAEPMAALPDGPLDLAPLWKYMLARGTPRDAATETVLFFHSRAPRWHVTMLLPPELEGIETPRRERIVSEVRSRGVSSGTYVGPIPTPPPDRKKTRSALHRPVGTPDGAIAHVTRVVLLVALGISTGLHFVPAEVNDAELSDRVAAAMGTSCAAVELTGHAARCTVSRETKENAERSEDRARLASVAFDVEVVFVDDEGYPTSLD